MLEYQSLCVLFRVLHRSRGHTAHVLPLEIESRQPCARNIQYLELSKQNTNVNPNRQSITEAAGSRQAATPAATVTAGIESAAIHVKLHSLIQHHQGCVNHLAFRPSDRHQHAAAPDPAGSSSFWFASASSDASIRIWSCCVGAGKEGKEGKEGTGLECIYFFDCGWALFGNRVAGKRPRGSQCILNTG